MQDYHEAELTVFHDKDGQEIKTCISKVIDFEMFMTEIARVRGYEDPEVILGCDGDSEKVILTCIIRDMNQEENENTLDNYNYTGKNRVLTLCKADGVPETRQNVEKLLGTLNLSEARREIKIVSDLKLVNIMAGIQSCTSLYACPYCEGSKVSGNTGMPTNKRGR